MPAPTLRKLFSAVNRILLWFAALFLSSIFFSVWLSRGLPNFDIVRITLIFALPAWLLYLPLVVTYCSATGSELRVLLIVGFLIGPASIAAWSMILPSYGRTDSEMGGLGGMMICAAIVGSVTTIFYVAALRLLRKRLL